MNGTWSAYSGVSTGNTDWSTAPRSPPRCHEPSLSLLVTQTNPYSVSLICIDLFQSVSCILGAGILRKAGGGPEAWRFLASSGNVTLSHWTRFRKEFKEL